MKIDLLQKLIRDEIEEVGEFMLTNIIPLFKQLYKNYEVQYPNMHSSTKNYEINDSDFEWLRSAVIRICEHNDFLIYRQFPKDITDKAKSWEEMFELIPRREWDSILANKRNWIGIVQRPIVLAD